MKVTITISVPDNVKVSGEENTVTAVEEYIEKVVGDNGQPLDIFSYYTKVQGSVDLISRTMLAKYKRYIDQFSEYEFLEGEKELLIADAESLTRADDKAAETALALIP